MAISITATYANRLSWSSTFGPAGECVAVFERWKNPSTDRRSVSAAITLGTLPMTLLASYEQSDEYVVAIWGAIVTPDLAGTSYTMTRTAGIYPSTDRFDVLLLSGVSTDMAFASHSIRFGSATSSTYSHSIDVKYGGMVIDLIEANSPVPHAGQAWCISSDYTSSCKADVNSGTTTMGWDWGPSRAVYACVSLRPKDTHGGITGIL